MVSRFAVESQALRSEIEQIRSVHMHWEANVGGEVS